MSGDNDVPYAGTMRTAWQDGYQAAIGDAVRDLAEYAALAPRGDADRILECAQRVRALLMTTLQRRLG